MPGPRSGSTASAGSTFEPTPPRGIPGAEDYTGVPAAQDNSIPDLGTPEPGAVTLPPTPTTVFSPPTTIRPRTDLPADPDARTPALPSGTATPTTPEDNGPSLWLLLAIPVIAAACARLPGGGSAVESARCPPAGHAAARQLGLAACMPGGGAGRCRRLTGDDVARVVERHRPQAPRGGASDGIARSGRRPGRLRPARLDRPSASHHLRVATASCGPIR